MCTVVRASPNVIELRIACGVARGEVLFLPRLPPVVSAADSGIGRPFRRLQFPVKLSLAMTINRCQGQTKRRVGIHLPALAHGQLISLSTALRAIIYIIKWKITLLSYCQNHLWTKK